MSDTVMPGYWMHETTGVLRPAVVGNKQRSN
jgi:hypothetical protein